MRRRGRLVLIAAVLTSLACGGGGVGPTPALPAARLSSLSPPIPVLAEGRLQLVYELLVENDGASTLSPSRLEVVGDGGPLLVAKASRLTSLVDPPRIAPGQLGFVFLWLEVEVRAAPQRLLNRLTLVGDSGDLLVKELTIGVSEIRPPSLGPPLLGGDWLGINSSNESGHRRVFASFGGVPRFAQRFAIDWVRLGPDGRTFAGDPLLNASYHAYGSEVLAAADGVVAARNDGVAENVPGRLPARGSVPLAGNFVLLQVDAEQSLLYAHLIPGSLRVGVGDRVRRGQLLGWLGNSGNSSEPHLHLHLARVFDLASESTLDADGRPFVLDRFFVQRGRSLTGTREHELPLEGAVIRFEEG